MTRLIFTKLKLYLKHDFVSFLPFLILFGCSLSSIFSPLEDPEEELRDNFIKTGKNQHNFYY